MTIVKESTYRVTLPDSLKDWDVIRHGEGVLNEKTIRELYRALHAWADEIGEAIGSLDLDQEVRQKTHRSWREMGKAKVLETLAKADRFLSAPDIMAAIQWRDTTINRNRLESILKELVTTKAIEGVNGGGRAIFGATPSKVVS